MTSYNSDNEAVSCIEVINGTVCEQLSLDLDIEEADARIVPHVASAIENGSKRIVVSSNDTDVFSLLLHHMHTFFSDGMEELWVRFGTSSNTRHIPLHTLSNMNGPTVSSVILKAHVLSGCDVTSKVDTKRAAINNYPEKYLNSFGEGDPCESSFKQAEKYLVKLLQPNSVCEIFMFLKRCKPISDLPPTSQSIQEHLLPGICQLTC